MDLEKKRLYHWLPWALTLAVIGLFILLLHNDLLRHEDFWQHSLLAQQKTNQALLQARLRELERQSMLLTQMIAQDKDVIELIRRAHQEFERNMDNGRQESSSLLRDQLEKLLQAYWKGVNVVGIQTLNIYFTPGATAFLRVNRAGRFGDDVSSINPMALAALQKSQSNTGVEVGRYGSAYRAIVPIFASSDQTQAPIAAIEVGLSLLSPGKEQGVQGQAVLLHPSVVNDVLWGAARAEVLENTGGGRGKWGIESFTQPIVKEWQARGMLPDLYARGSQPWILPDQDKNYLLMVTPIPDYSSHNLPAAVPKLLMLNWIDMTQELAEYELSLASLKWKYLLEVILAEALLWCALYFNRRHVLQLLRDHSKQLQQERDLSEQSRHRLTLALSSSESGFWEWNIATNKAIFSKEWRELCGLSPDTEDTADIEEWLSRVHPADKRGSYTEMIRHIKGETPMFENEYRVQIADGSYKWIFTRGKVVEWQENGRAGLMLGVYTDITDRKKNEIIVIRQQAALRALNEIASLPIVDAEDQLMRALAVGARYFGVSHGCVSRIQGNQYEIKVQVPPALNRSITIISALCDYLCEETYRREDVFALDDINQSAFARHTSQKIHKVESYIGVPVWLGGKIYGTLSFSSEFTRHQDFDDLDKDFMRLFSRWVSATLDRWQYQFEQKVLLDRFAKISQSLPGFLYQYQMSPDGTSFFPYCSSGIKEIYGVHPEDVVASAEKIFNALHPDDVGWISESISTSGSNLTIWTATYRVMHPVRGEIWVRGEAQPERLADGGTLWHGFIHDVTEEKHAILKLQETNTLREAIFDAASISIISTDKNGLIKTFNRGAETMLGYSADEVINKMSPISFHLANEIIARTEKLNRELGWKIEPGFETFCAKVREGDEDENEWTYVHKNGTHTPVLLTSSALRDPDGEITGYLGLARDISELKRIDKMKSEFISTVSHELRTPLTAISGALGIIMGGAVGTLPDTATKMLNIAHKNSLRLIHLVNDLLDMEKLVAGKMHFDMQSQSMLPILQQSIEANITYAQQFNVRFELQNLLQQESRVLIDSQRLQQVLTNFLSNAVKFSPANEVVFIKVEEKYNYLRVTVIDKGSGIAEDFHGRIFQKFSQADSSDSRQKGGTGLGLAICKEIIERMGGKIGFNSVVGKGSEFYFDIPCEEMLAQHFERHDHKKPTGNRILVVEDDREVADVLAIMLGNANLRVDLAHTAQSALERSALYSYQLITIDLNLPDMNGLQLIRQLRSDAITQHLPIVVISARLDEARLSVRGDPVFADIEWMEKPLEEVYLIKAIKNLLQKNSKTEVPS